MLSSGIDQRNTDKEVRTQDDFYRHVNGTWLKNTEIPADKSAWGAGAELRENILPQLRAIIESIAKGAGPKTGSEAQKISDLYASFMDEKKLEDLGLKPLDAEFARIAALKDKQ